MLVLGVAIRIGLAPLQHTWDSQTWWNVVAQLGSTGDPIKAVALPFESMRSLSDLVHGSGFRQYYEYWAYPPGMLLLWWPVARAWTMLVGPLSQQFSAPDALNALPLHPLLALVMKVPVIAGDVATAAALARVSGPASGRWWLLNPFVLLAGLWMFDGLMVAFLVWGLIAASRQRWAVAGVLLGLGGAIKFVPLVLLPVVALWALRFSPKPVRSALEAVSAAVFTFGVVCLPWLDGLQLVLQFHAARPGGGLAWQSVWNALPWIDPFIDLSAVTLYMSPQIGLITLSGALILTTWIGWYRKLDLWEMSLAILLAYIAGSKLVNEVYPLPACAVALALVSRQTVKDTRLAVLLRWLWVAPLLFALVNVPAWGFLLAPANFLGLLDLETARLFFAGYVLTYRYLAPVLAVAGTGFQLFCIWGIWQLISRPNVTSVARPIHSHPVAWPLARAT